MSGAFLARLACDPEFAGVSAAYYSIGAREESSVASKDEAKQAALWAYSEELLKQVLAQGAGAGAAAPAVAAT